jgi:hypothetical protein
LIKQILSDGAHYERSVMYHTIMLAKLCVCIDVTQQSKKVDTNYFQNKAALMVGWLNQYSFPDGSWALFNDAALEITTDTKTINQVLKQMKIDPIFIPMNDCGFRKMSGTNWEALLNVGNIQPSYQPGHSHADMLSFCLWYKGKQVIVDPGVSTYNNNIQRQNERATYYHNTITVNAGNQSDVWSAFRIGKRAKLTVLKDDSECIAASHNGYGSVNVQRTFTNKNNCLTINDYIKEKKTGSHISNSLLFAVDIDLSVKEKLIEMDGIKIEFNGLANIEHALYATSYNQIKKSQRIRLVNNLSSELRFFFK